MARDPDGILREASWEERQKMCQVYFPAFGREIHVPKMFEDQHLDVSHSFKIVLGICL